ncbi:MAG: flippase-like domain-containing protein, partial [Candidatus Omnitrophica bacterium]|nr:flippase-like domain-containing protein [Candidatus Omnitrophota bacterium]
MNRSRKVWVRLLPAIVSLGLIGLGLFLLRDSFPDLLAVLRKAHFLPLLFAFLAYVVATFILSQRMRCIFSTVGVRARAWDFFYYLLIATFTSSFFRIPGGAALVTAVVSSTDLKAPFQVCLVGSVADRLIGMLTVPLLAAIGLWWAVADPDTLGKA